MEPLSLTQMPAQRGGSSDRQGRSAIVAAFPTAHNNLPPIEVDILDAQR